MKAFLQASCMAMAVLVATGSVALAEGLYGTAPKEGLTFYGTPATDSNKSAAQSDDREARRAAIRAQNERTNEERRRKLNGGTAAATDEEEVEEEGDIEALQDAIGYTDSGTIAAPVTHAAPAPASAIGDYLTPRAE